MKITFLGTGGGRFNTISQLRATGGWILEIDKHKLSVDPGPGAIVRANQYGISLSGLTGLLISHAHPDHYTDAEIIIEAMTKGVQKKAGFLIANEHIIKGGEGFTPSISPYHQNIISRIEILEPGKKVEIDGLEITGTKSLHTEPKAIGFLIKGSKSIGYISDTEYFDGIEKQFEGCDYLVLNTLRPKKINWPKHLNSEGARKIISHVKPAKAIITHFGIKMLEAVPEREAEWIQEKSGIATIAAKDGMSLDLEKKGLEKYI
jgi:phosphoribosyl 1,2-cyclic phosphodiesterase